MKINGELKSNLGQESQRYASEMHNKWRESRKPIAGTAIDGLPMREERWKPVDPQEPDGPKVDIANTPFDSLPPAWQNENLLSAETAIKDIDGLTDETPGVVDLEEASAKTHVAWKERNPWAEGEQAGPYSDLSPAEKDKDREVIEGAVGGLEDRYDLRLVNKGWKIGERLRNDLEEKKKELTRLLNEAIISEDPGSESKLKKREAVMDEVKALEKELADYLAGRHLDSPYEKYDESEVGTEGAQPSLPTSDKDGEDRYGYKDGETLEDKQRRTGEQA